ncbi:hypothetical protein CRG98_030164 [Punica granatum]|uniref:Uncharacterized protein n=1 Tax=Punica granatum TaxID=22663 RepID=A0A2I0IZM6_PUNGR|nr:hypothetical protein CRG98_030164 [Punica granatum]
MARVRLPEMIDQDDGQIMVKMKEREVVVAVEEEEEGSDGNYLGSAATAAKEEKEARIVMVIWRWRLQEKLEGSIDFGNPRRKTRLFPSIPAVSTPVKSKSDTAQPKRCPKPSLAPSRAVVAASRGENRHPQRRRRSSRQSRPPRQLTGLDPFLLLRRSSPEVRPITAQRPQSGPTALPGGFSFGRASPIQSDPTRLSGNFFYFTEKPLNFPD